MICCNCGHIADEAYMTVTEAAELLRVSESRVRQLVKADRIADAGTVGPAHLVHRASVEKRAASIPRPGRPRKVTQ